MDFSTFYASSLPLIKSIAAQHCLTPHEADDVVQEVFIAFWKKFRAGKIDDSKNTQGYISVLAHWRAKDRCRAKQTLANVTHNFEEDQSIEDLEEPQKYSPYLEDQKEQLSEVVKSVLGESTLRDAAIFEGFLRGEEINYTAKTLDVGMNTVYLARHRMFRKVVKKAKEIL